MKIIDEHDNELICRVGSPLNGIKLKKVYVWDEEVSSIDWDSYVKKLEPKFVCDINIKVNIRFEKRKIN